MTGQRLYANPQTVFDHEPSKQVAIDGPDGANACLPGHLESDSGKFSVGEDQALVGLPAKRPALEFIDKAPLNFLPSPQSLHLDRYSNSDAALSDAAENIHAPNLAPTAPVSVTNYLNISIA